MKILIIDDHELFRNGLCLLLEKKIKKMTVHHADTCSVALNILNTKKPALFDYIFLDIDLPDVQGLSGVIEIHKASPKTPIIAVSGFNQHDLINSLPTLRGVYGFINKTESSNDIELAIEKIMKGDKYFSFNSGKSERSIDLTGKQLQILSLIGRGFTNQKISNHLDISENTVKNHVATVLKILNADNRSEALFIARKMNII